MPIKTAEELIEEYDLMCLENVQNILEYLQVKQLNHHRDMKKILKIFIKEIKY